MILWLYVGKLICNSSNPDVNSDIGMSMRTYTGNGSYRNMSHGSVQVMFSLLLIHTIATTLGLEDLLVVVGPIILH